VDGGRRTINHYRPLETDEVGVSNDIDVLSMRRTQEGSTHFIELRCWGGMVCQDLPVTPLPHLTLGTPQHDPATNPSVVVECSTSSTFGEVE
jgi:hypothetical protein